MKTREMSAFDRRICYLHFSRGGPWGKHQVGQEAEGAWGIHGPEPRLCSPQERHGRAEETAADWLV